MFRLNEQHYYYFFNLRCFVGGSNPGCSGHCIMKCFIPLSNKSLFHVESESEQRGASSCCGVPAGELLGLSRTGLTESCHNGELRGPCEGLCAAPQSHLQCSSVQCPETEGLV